ncbi:hypothetical protein ACJX0J_020134, partial [Zea mays]
GRDQVVVLIGHIERNTKVGYKATTNTTVELMWLQILLKEVKISSPKMYLSSNHVFYARIKHIEKEVASVSIKTLYDIFKSGHDQVVLFGHTKDGYKATTNTTVELMWLK